MRCAAKPKIGYLVQNGWYGFLLSLRVEEQRRVAIDLKQVGVELVIDHDVEPEQFIIPDFLLEPRQPGPHGIVHDGLHLLIQLPDILIALSQRIYQIILWTDKGTIRLASAENFGWSRQKAGAAVSFWPSSRQGSPRGLG